MNKALQLAKNFLEESSERMIHRHSMAYKLVSSRGVVVHHQTTMYQQTPGRKLCQMSFQIQKQ